MIGYLTTQFIATMLILGMAYQISKEEQDYD